MKEIVEKKQKEKINREIKENDKFIENCEIICETLKTI